MSDDLSCPSCDRKPMIRKTYLAISRMKKLKMDFCALCCGRRYCGVGIYKTVFKCRSCGWKGNPYYSDLDA
ncbi:uncharacterized protein LOC108026729 [Drosophila biarmipes]|uniref:uncharacterized protein LOC108026729 n=1 Tax=Drosophila biarmipes TaxID=125945 RepID=UPI0007E81BE9|nr:uncharacterized protein LOC108026729 [Drosophila biarmipes]XP_050743388.1 uncharacterized protein LOC108026729 [Drosophila biarmipes]